MITRLELRAQLLLRGRVTSSCTPLASKSTDSEPGGEGVGSRGSASRRLDLDRRAVDGHRQPSVADRLEVEPAV